MKNKIKIISAFALLFFISAGAFAAIAWPALPVGFPDGGRIGQYIQFIKGATEAEDVVTIMKPVEVKVAANQEVKLILEAGATLAAGSSVESSVADCTSDGELGCKSTTSFKAVDMLKLIAENIKQGLVIAGITGTASTGTNLDNIYVLNPARCGDGVLQADKEWSDAGSDVCERIPDIQLISKACTDLGAACTDVTTPATYIVKVALMNPTVVSTTSTVLSFVDAAGEGVTELVNTCNNITLNEAFSECSVEYTTTSGNRDASFHFAYTAPDGKEALITGSTNISASPTAALLGTATHNTFTFDFMVDDDVVSIDFVAEKETSSNMAVTTNTLVATADNGLFISNAYLQEDGYKASATVVFTANPVDGHTLTLNGTLFTYRTTPSVANDVLIGVDISTSINNLLTEALPVIATYTKVGTDSIFIEYATIGVAGNAYTIASNFITVPATLSGGSDTPDGDWIDNTPTVEYNPPSLSLNGAETTTTALVGYTPVIANDPVRVYNATDGLVDGVLGTTTTTSASTMLDYTTANGFTSTYDYQSKFHKHNITKDTTVSDITGWTTGTSLPGALTYSQAIVTKSRVYLLGGYNGVHVSTVYTAPINTDGTLGTWTTGTSLPGALYGSQAIVTKSRVYLLGGYNGTTHVSTVYTAPINIDGTLGTWTTGTSLPGALLYSQAIVTKSRVYLLGGSNGTTQVPTVYTAPINTDGTLGTWTTGTSLPGALYGSQAIVTKSRVYLLGGSNVSAVYTATINTDGTLGAWTTGTSLPGALGISQAIVTKSRVYLLGGYNGVHVSTVYTAPINTDGTLGAWTTGTSLPGALGISQAIVTKSRVYLLGGHNGTVVSTVYTAPFVDGWSIAENDYQTIVPPKYTSDISLLGLTVAPTKAWLDKPISVSTCTEATAGRCNAKDETLTVTGTPTTTAASGISGISGLIETGDEVVLSTGAVVTSGVVETDLGGGSYQYDLTFPTQGSAPTTLAVADRSTTTTEASDVYDSINDKFTKIYNKIVQQGRAFKYKISADRDVEVTKVTIPMTKQSN